MDCKQFKRLIGDELDGQLEGRLLREFAEHRAKCRSCDQDYLKHRRIQLYMRRFPTVSKVSGRFRAELMSRVRNGDLRSHYRLNYARVTVSLAFLAVVFFGVLFGVNTYQEYIGQQKAYIALAPEGHEPGEMIASSRALADELKLRPGDSVFALSLPDVSTEEFVLKLLADYERGAVSEELLSKLAVETGLLDGVSMKIPEQASAVDILLGHYSRGVVIFPRQLPSIVLAYVTRRDLRELRSFTLEVINTYGAQVTLFGSSTQIAPEVLEAISQWREEKGLEIVDVSGASFSVESLPDGTEVPLVLSFRRDGA